MSRPVIYNNLRPIQVLIESEAINQAKSLGINISDVCRQALESMVGDPKTKEMYFKFMKIPSYEMRKVRRFVVENTERAGFWANWLNQKYGTELTPQDILNKIEIG